MPYFSSQTFPDAESAARALAAEFARWLAGGAGPVNVAFSGGRTPERFFAELACEKYRRLPWERLRVFWVDERWVPPESLESNFGNAWRTLFGLLGFPAERLFPMVPQATGASTFWPEVVAATAARYSELLRRELPLAADGVPVFDLVLLGLGTDGHTASLFPGAVLETPDAPCSATKHPVTGAPRLTLTLPVLNRARRVVFLVTGAEKAVVLRAVRSGADLPAAKVAPLSGPATWYLDAAVAG